ncbi:MAG: formyltransferase family protein [Bacteroidota bacterium]
MTIFRKIISNDSLWGEFYEPEKPKLNLGKGLRVVLFGSCNCGNNTLKNLSLFEKKYPTLLNVVGVVTDDPVDPRARISLKKRIWSQYSPDERSSLREMIINTSMEIGIPCYTGAVKTDYFRNIYKSWNPDAIIMFCFGQKLDPFLYEYPVMGAYNFHPSDLPKQIGAGTQPFQNAIRNGLKTSPTVIHQVTDLIDMGPIVGVSTPVNICLQDGTYPQSILTLLEKITSIGAWMAIQLITVIVSRRAAGKTGPVDWIDFSMALPPEVRQLLMAPATNDITESYEVPVHPVLLQ